MKDHSFFYGIEEPDQPHCTDRNDNFFRELAQNAPDLFYCLRLIPGRRIEYINLAALAFTGYPPEEYYANSDLFFKVVHPNDRSLLESLMLTMESHEELLFLRLMHRDGSVIWTEHWFRPIYDSRGRIQSVEGIARNICQRKQAEEKLKKFAYEQTLLLDNIETQIWYLTDIENYGAVNKAHADFLGIKKENLQGQSLYNIVSKQEAEVCIAGNREVFDKRKQIRTEEWVKNGKGKLRLLSIIKTPKLDENGKVEYLICTAEDITERRGLENDLRKARDDLETQVKERTSELKSVIQALLTEIDEHKSTAKKLQKAKGIAETANKAKSDFLATMSHEIRTPMNAVIGMTDLLLQEDLTADQRDLVETIRNSGEELLTIINDILDFSWIEKEKVELEFHPFGIRACVEDSLDLMAAKAKEKNLSLAYSIDESVPDTIIGDFTRVRQILVNLLSNAVKFTYKGKVTVSIRASQMTDDSCEIHFSVEDTGIGIPEESLGKIFQPFSQADMSTTRRYGGMGLGLAISKKLVEMMGGTIWAESEAGKGSVFHFTVSTHAAEVRSDSLERPPKFGLKHQAGHCRPLCILLAEDNTINQKVMLRMLRKLGYRADAVANGLEVLQALQRQPYDIILMDVQMPMMDGLEAARAVRAMNDIKQPKIIAITAYALAGDRETCLEAGMDCYIPKPVQIDDLKAALEAAGPSIPTKDFC
jgi:PAS domain S-box-containing protein